LNSRCSPLETLNLSPDPPSSMLAQFLHTSCKLLCPLVWQRVAREVYSSSDTYTLARSCAKPL
jgi:hypothetical protein